MSSPRVPSPADSDTEHTAELPVLDPAAQAAAGEHRVSQTDTLILPALAAPPTEASVPAAHPGEHRMSQTDTWIAPPVAAGLAEARDARAGEHRQSQSDTLILPPLAAEICRIVFNADTPSSIASHASRVLLAERINVSGGTSQ